MKKYTGLVLGLLLFTFVLPTHAQSQKSNYKVVDKIHLPGNSWWDYLTVDNQTGRLFVSHGTEVLVVDTHSGKLLKTIPHTTGVHGIALAHNLNKGFISDGGSSTVTVFNLETLNVIKTINVTGKDPDCILYDPFTKRVFTFNGRSSNVTVIDAENYHILGTIKLDGNPEFAVTDDHGHIFDNIESKSEIAEINPLTMKIDKEWSIAPGEGPSGLAIDNVHHYLFSVCHNKKMVISDAQTGKVVTTLPIGGHVDGAAFDPVLNRAYSSNGEGSLTVVQESGNGTFSVLENLPTQSGARTIALDEQTHHLYLPTAQYLPRKSSNDGRRHRPKMKPGSFVVLNIAPINK